MGPAAASSRPAEAGEGWGRRWGSVVPSVERLVEHAEVLPDSVAGARLLVHWVGGLWGQGAGIGGVSKIASLPEKLLQKQERKGKKKKYS